MALDELLHQDLEQLAPSRDIDRIGVKETSDRSVESSQLGVFIDTQSQAEHLQDVRHVLFDVGAAGVTEEGREGRVGTLLHLGVFTHDVLHQSPQPGGAQLLSAAG